MSSLTSAEKATLERYFQMSGGYVLDFTDREFGQFVSGAVGIDIHAAHYQTQGTSKAKKLRAFWDLEPDRLVGKLLLALIDRRARTSAGEDALEQGCRQVATRLLAGPPSLNSVREPSAYYSLGGLQEQLGKLDAAVEADPALAITMALELVKAGCKGILGTLGLPTGAGGDVSTLIKATIGTLELFEPSGKDALQGAEVIKRLLTNLGTITATLVDLQNLYGNKDGEPSSATHLRARHARLAVGTAATLTRFLFETHKEAQRPEYVKG